MKAQIKEIGEIVIAGRKYLEVIPGETNVDFKSEWMNFFEDIKEINIEKDLQNKMTKYLTKNVNWHY